MRPRPAAPAAVAAVLLTASLAAPRPARAWSNQGHMATGAIAYDDLARTSPALVASVVRLMAAHPDRARFDAALGAPIGRVLSFTTGRAEAAFAENLAVARDPDAGDARRAVALCWLFHLAGDIHQPLHAGTWWSWRFLRSDRAGTLSYVRVAPGEAMTFHDFWDGVLDRAEPAGLAGEVAGAGAIAGEVEARYPRAALGVPAGAAADARALGLRRVALAGCRVADVVRGVGGGAGIR